MKFIITVIGCLGVVMGTGACYFAHQQTVAFESEVRNRSELVLSFSMACRDYVSKRLRPAVKRETSAVIPEAVSSTVATTGIFQYFTTYMPGYLYRQPTLNPLNLANQADGYEQKIVEKFRIDRATTEQTGYRVTEGEERFYVARPIVVQNDCLKCHDTPQSAPKTIVDLYGTTHGYGWKEGEVVSAAMVSVPTKDLISHRQAMMNTVLCTFLVLTAIVIGSVFVLFEKIINRRIRHAAATMRQIANNPSCSLRIADDSRDEIGSMANTFNAMADRVSSTHSVLEERISKGRIDLRNATASLAESEARFRVAYEHAPIGMALLAPDGRWLKVNPALCDIVGYTSSELTSMTFQDITYPEDVNVGLEDLKRLDKGQTTSVEIARRYVHKSGAVVWVQVNVSVVRDDNEKPLYRIAQIQDITRRRRLEEEIRQTQKMEAIGRLAGGVAHDFNNLLTVILGRADILLRNKEFNAQARRGVELIESTAERAATLTRQLLQFSRQQVIQPKNIDLNGVLIEMDEMLRRLIGEHIEISIRTVSKLPVITTDPGQLQQVIMNLSVNARDAMPKGGTLTIQTSSIDIVPSQSRHREEIPPGKYVRLSISDTGCGMDAITRARIFEPFFTTKEQGKGTGLGLSTVYGIVKQSGGYIYVYSEVDMGTTFKIYWPASEDSHVSSSDSSSFCPNVKGESETILVAEDEKDIRDLLAEILIENGYNVIVACNGEDAIRISDTHNAPIHLLVTDVVMPKMCGTELVQRIQSKRCEIKVLFMSGYTSDRLATQGVMQTGIEFLEKPFTPNSVAKKVKEILSTRRSPA